LKKNTALIHRIKSTLNNPATKRQRILWTTVGLLAAGSFGTFLDIPRDTAIVLGGLTVFCAVSAYEHYELKRRLDALLDLFDDELEPPKDAAGD
jgi:hypothetical protein